jgi:predicted N-acetyltransferase YhbS
MITYHLEKLSVEDFIDVLNDSTLGERRPVNNLPRIQQMLENANLIVVAKDENKIVGVARSLSDFTYCTYLSDLAVRKGYQKMGIGKELIRQTKIASGEAKVILLSAPAAVKYYPKIGMTKHNHCYLLSSIDELKSAK